MRFKSKQIEDVQKLLVQGQSTSEVSKNCDRFVSKGGSPASGYLVNADKYMQVKDWEVQPVDI